MSKPYKLFIFIILSGLILSCSFTETRQGREIRYSPGKGGRNYGGILKINEAEYIKNLFPHSITDVYSYRVAAQIYEGLFKFNPRDLSIENSLAESYNIDSTGTVYTFHLKQGVFFHDDPAFPEGKGRELIAADVAYCFTQLCTPSPNNQSFSVFKDVIKGATAYYKNSNKANAPQSVEGIKVLGKHSIEITLTRPNPMFITNLARPACFIYPEEAEKAYGIDMRIKAIGTGPFTLQEADENIQLILKRNNRYYRKDTFGNQLPFLEAISIQFIKEKKTEILHFKKGDIDMIYRLSPAYINELLENTDPNEAGGYGDYHLQSAPEMVTQFLSFNNENPVFKNIAVRKAFSFAIDREKILEFVLQGEGYAPGIHGITPPVFPDYDIRKIAGYYLDIDSAKYYLAKAGYPDGKDFPEITLDFNAEGERNTAVAVEIQKQLYDNLNIKIKLNTLPFAQLLEKGYKGEYDLLRTAWYADFPNVENFLWLFYESYGSSSMAHPNIMRFNYPTFNIKYEEAIKAKTHEEAYDLFMEAEKILMKEAPVLILWYDQGYRIVKNHVKNFPTNPMQYRDYSEVFFQHEKH